MSDYIKLFDSTTQQDTFTESEDYIQPHVSCTKGGGNLRYNNGSGGITADDITPGLFDDVRMRAKAKNYGFRDEDILNLPTITFLDLSNLEWDEDLRYTADIMGGNMNMNGAVYSFEDTQHTANTIRDLYHSNYNYVAYNASAIPVVLRLNKMREDFVRMISIDECLEITFVDDTFKISIGPDTF